MKTNQGPAYSIYSSKYGKIYNSLIAKRQIEVLQKTKELYTESHHIVPRSLGGTDDSDNLVRLTAKEHFVAHCLLARMYKEGTNEWYKMHFAVSRMKCSPDKQHIKYFNSRLYAISIEIAHKRVGEIVSVKGKGEGNSCYGKIWINNPTLEISKKINKNENIPLGWFKGRIIDFRLHEFKNNQKIEKEKRIKLLKAEYKSLYMIYNSLGWKKLVETTGYKHTRENLIYQFSVYVPEYIPNRYVKRGSYKRASHGTLAKSKNV